MHDVLQQGFCLFDIAGLQSPAQVIESRAVDPHGFEFYVGIGLSCRFLVTCMQGNDKDVQAEFALRPYCRSCLICPGTRGVTA